MRIRDRIKELRRVPARKLIPNPANWRTHPNNQINAMRGILAEVGWADAVLARETPDGLQLIDGHLRSEIAPDADIPVLVLDLNEDEAALLLASHDPIGAMAETDSSKLEQLLNELSPQSSAMQEMLDRMARDAGIVPPEFLPVDVDDSEHQEKTITCPHCGHEFTGDDCE